MKLIKRVKYLNEIAELIGIPDIKVITGIRCRCGKSKIMDALTELIKESDSSGNVSLKYIFIHYPIFRLTFNSYVLDMNGESYRLAKTKKARK